MFFLINSFKTYCPSSVIEKYFFSGPKSLDTFLKDTKFSSSNFLKVLYRLMISGWIYPFDSSSIKELISSEYRSLSRTDKSTQKVKCPFLYADSRASIRLFSFTELFIAVLYCTYSSGVNNLS